MFLRKMYEIEKIIESYRKKGVTDKIELLELSNKHNFSSNQYFYYRYAVIIPYVEMLEYIYYYNAHDYDEGEDALWWDRLNKKYEKVDGVPILHYNNYAYMRFVDVEKLSKSIIYGKKLKNLFNIDSNELKMKWKNQPWSVIFKNDEELAYNLQDVMNESIEEAQLSLIRTGVLNEDGTKKEIDSNDENLRGFLRGHGIEDVDDYLSGIDESEKEDEEKKLIRKL